MDPTLPAACPNTYLLRYLPLNPHCRALAFACDATGQVDLDRLSERLRNDYFLARHSVGRRMAAPRVEVTRAGA